MNAKKSRCKSKVPIKQLVFGILSFVPIVFRLYKKSVGESQYSNSNPRFCYSVWLRMLVTLHDHKPGASINNIAEIGSGPSFGTGLAALLSGAETYTSLEVVPSKAVEKNLFLFDELVKLFKAKADIPDDNEFARINIKLDDYAFPHNILSCEKMEKLLAPERLDMIRHSIENPDDEEGAVNALVPWESSLDRIKSSFDLIFSRAVMEHVVEYEKTYKNLHDCLKPEGAMLHDIEYHNHGMGPYWNSHWSYTEFQWFIMKGKRSFITNRTYHSIHLDAIKKTGFKLNAEDRVIKKSELELDCFSKSFKHLSDLDISSFGGWVLASK